MSTKPIVLLDCDGVLANFTQATVDDINRLLGTNYSEKDAYLFETLDSFALSKRDKKYLKSLRSRQNWCKEIPPYENAKEHLKVLKNIADVYVVTSPWMSDHWVPERYKWLKDHFNIDHDQVFFCRNKWMVHGDIFVDDKPENVIDYKSRRSDTLVYLWAQPYNQGLPEVPDTVQRTGDWNDLIASVIGKTK